MLQKLCWMGHVLCCAGSACWHQTPWRRLKSPCIQKTPVHRPQAHDPCGSVLAELNFVSFHLSSKIWERDLVDEELNTLVSQFAGVARVTYSRGMSIISLICNVERTSQILERVGLHALFLRYCAPARSCSGEGLHFLRLATTHPPDPGAG